MLMQRTQSVVDSSRENLRYLVVSQTQNNSYNLCNAKKNTSTPSIKFYV